MSFLPPPNGGGVFAPQARPKMSDFEQKRQFFDVFPPILVNFHPYGGFFAPKSENYVISEKNMFFASKSENYVICLKK